MNFKEHLNTQPLTLTILPTHKCTASCRQCCFGCGPKIQYVMETSKVTKYIDDVMNEYPSIRVIVFSGGECFLLGDELAKVIKHAKKYNVVTRVVTNGFWASTYENAYEKLKTLVEVGLNEINFSTGENHQEYVKFENIINGTLASYDLGIKPIVISVEYPPNAKFTANDVKNNIKLSPLIEEGVLTCFNASWMYFKNNIDEEICCEEYNVALNTKRPCVHLFNSISISPYSQVLACCGLTVEYNEYLKLGDLESNNIKELFEKQFEDLYKLWLHIDGPEVIYELLLRKKGIKGVNFPHECAYCIELVRDKNNIPIIKELIEENLASILYRLQMKKTRLKIHSTVKL